MKIRYAYPLLAAFAITACGSEPEEGTVGEGMSADEVAASMETAEMPRPGQYRSTQELLELDIPGMNDEMRNMFESAFAEGAAQESTYCLTAEEAGNPREEMLRNMAESDCTVSRFEISGGTIDAEMSCPSGEAMTGNVMMTGTMGGDGADMVMNFSAEMPGAGEASIRMRVVSERIGECA